MGHSRKSRPTYMGLLVDDRTNKRLLNLQTRKMQLPEDVSHDRVVARRHPTKDRASISALTFNVAVIYDKEENLWVAECDSLGIVTEAKTFELLTQRVQDLVPDMIAANKVELGRKKPYLNFTHLEEAVI